MFCEICDDAATHYYWTVAKTKSGRCQYHADTFGYTQYLIEINPAPQRPYYGYLINVTLGDGFSDHDADIWPMASEDKPEEWLEILGCKESEYLIADAAWSPYLKHLSVNDGYTYEATRVTCLPLV
ncbi:hypothetical protein [Streptomyces sp. NPDC055793]